jgi:Domain of unknown function (DUF5916)
MIICFHPLHVIPTRITAAFALFCLVFLGQSFARAQTSTEPITASIQAASPFDSYVLHIQRTPKAPVIDGKINEEMWMDAPLVQNFVQHYPTDSVRAHSQVTVRAMYDNEYMYFAFTCFDSTAGNFFFRSLRRDYAADESDGVMIILDPLGTGQNGFGFRVSPLGVQSEGFVANGGNFGMDRTWDNIWFSGTHVEKDRWTAEFAIPFRAIRFEGGRKRWRINVARWDWVRNELSTWTRFPINFNAFSLAHTGVLEWDIPPSTSGLNMSIIPSLTGLYNRSFAADGVDKWNYNIGGDIKYAITPSLNLDATINPDFSNVSVDQQVTNLNRFSIFFPEQRQFFIENSDLFSQFGFSQIRPFFSRKIGLVNDPTNSGALAPIAIPVGARLTGNLDDNWRVGLLSMQTAASERFNLETQNYTVAAAQRRVFGRSNIGMIFVNRQGRNFNEQGNDFNRTLGADFNLLSNDGTWQGKLFYHQNFTPNQKADQFASAGWLRYSVPGLEVNWNHEYIGSNYSPEVGFVPRRGVWRWQPFVQKTFYPEDRTIVNEHGTGIEQSSYFDNSGRFNVLDNESFVYYYVNFTNTMNASVFGGNIYTRLTFPFDPTGRGDKANELPIGEYNYWRLGGDFSTDRRSLFSAFAAVRVGGYFNGTNLNVRGSLAYRFQPFGSITMNFQQDNIVLPQPYRSAQLNLASILLDITPTRDIFITAFVQYNTQLNNLNLNTRVQWRFAPMSDVFLVYTDNYDATMLQIRNRAIALKVTYWLNI